MVNTKKKRIDAFGLNRRNPTWLRRRSSFSEVDDGKQSFTSSSPKNLSTGTRWSIEDPEVSIVRDRLHYKAIESSNKLPQPLEESITVSRRKVKRVEALV